MELEFERDGVLVLHRAFDPTGLADELWRGITSRNPIDRDDPSTWPVGAVGTLTKFGKSGVFAGIASEQLASAITALLGGNWAEAGRWGQPLITFPTTGPWNVPSVHWHIDMPFTRPLSAVRMFAYLSTVRTGGGGTLVVAGSHRLASAHEGVRSADLRKRLAAQHDWFRELLRPEGDHTRDRQRELMDTGATLEGVRVRVVELTGEPGDIVLWHPSLLHTIAPNCTAEPRFMLTHTAYRRGRHEECLGDENGES